EEEEEDDELSPDIIDVSDDEEEIVDGTPQSDFAKALYNRPGIIVANHKKSVRKLQTLKKSCLQMMSQQPDFNKIIDRLLSDTIRRICIKPGHRNDEDDDDMDRDRNYAKELKRVMWMAEIDKSLRVHGNLPPSVPQRYVDERAGELSERLTTNLEVEEALYWEQWQQRLDDEAAAAAADSPSTSSSASPSIAPLVGQPSSTAPNLASTCNSRLLRLQSSYDRMKNEKTYWNDREDGMWKRRRPLPQKKQRQNGSDNEEIALPPATSSETINRLSSVPKGAVLFEIAKAEKAEIAKETGQNGMRKPKRTIPMSKALQRIDIDSLSVPQMKKMIAALENRRGSRRKVRPDRITLSPTKPTLETTESKMVKGDKLRPSQTSSLLEWSMARLTKEEIELELGKHDDIEIGAASKQQILDSIVRLQKLKASVYSQLCSTASTSSHPMEDHVEKEGERRIIKPEKSPIKTKPTKKKAKKRPASQPVSRLEGTVKKKEKKKDKVEASPEFDEGVGGRKDKKPVVRLGGKVTNGKKREVAKKVKKAKPVVVELESSEESDSRSEQSIEDAKIYQRQKEVAEAYRAARKNSDSEHSRDSQLSADSFARLLDDQCSVEGGYRYNDDEEEEETLADGVVIKRRRREVDPTGFSLLPTRSIQRYRERFGLETGEHDHRATMVIGAQMHFGSLEGSASAIPYFAHALKTGTNDLDEREARQMQLMLQRQAAQQAQLEALGQAPPPGRGTRYRVAANTRRQQLIVPEEVEEQEEPEEEEEPEDI
ncbi:hypothetical protein PFISCL1PPCAC_11356, partial [Pristionchus fissidentatus]